MRALFDSHAHLTFRDFASDLSDVLQRAQDVGVKGIITIGSGGGPDVFREALRLAQQHDWIWSTAGLHPHDARFGDSDLLRALAEVASDPKVVALGEAGLDYHYDRSPRRKQREMFRAQLELAQEVGKPIVIHTRQADEDTLALLRHVGPFKAGGVVHCFSGGPAFAEKVLELGFSLSFSGILTFPKADDVREAARLAPDERLMIETDCPFLAPVPQRGKRNEPALVIEVAKILARERRLTLDDIARMTNQNTRNLFSLGESATTPIVYAIRDQLYVNLSNTCTLACVFCPKRRDWTVKGHFLKHAQEPSDDAIRKALEAAQPEKYREVVFCGLGEPTTRYLLVLELGRKLKKQGIRTRLDTDGLASLRQGRDVTLELGQAFDAVSVSLNAPDGETYSRLCPSIYGTEAWHAAVEFLRNGRETFAEVTASVVAVPGLDIESARRLVEDKIGVRFRVREFNVVG